MLSPCVCFLVHTYVLTFQLTIGAHREKHPHVQAFSCPTHAIDLFLSNVGSSNDVVEIQGNPITKQEVQRVQWGETFFSSCFDDVWLVVKFVTNHHKSLARYRTIAKNLPADKKPEGGTEPQKFGETRFASKVMMARRMMECRIIYEKLMCDDEYLDWLSTQKSAMKETVSTDALSADWMHVFVSCSLPRCA